MFEKDYVMRLIKELARAIMKALFNLEVNEFEDLKLEENAVSEKYFTLLLLLKQGEINEAENELYEIIDFENLEDLKTAVLFYDTLNRLEDEVLLHANFSREEIKEGLNAVLKQYGYEGFTDIFSQ